MNATELTAREAELVRAAAAVGGWLSAEHVNAGYRDEMSSLMHRSSFEDVFWFDSRQAARYVLTPFGRKLAAEIGGGR